MRSTTIATLVIVFLIPLALGLIYVKRIVQNLESDLAALERSINSDQDEIHVLKAEWAYLSRPERVKNLAAKYLDLQATNSHQIADISTIPLKSDAYANAEAVVIPSSFSASY